MPTDADLKAEAGRWAYHPGHKVEANPLFDWPLRPLAVCCWYRAYWLVVSTTTLSMLVAILAVWLWAPTLTEISDIGIGWFIAIWLGFLIPHTVLAGGLHLWLVRRKGQGQTLKYDPRDQAHNNGVYTFRSQVLDNMFWSLVSGISIATFYTCLWFWAAANGAATTVTFAGHPIWYVLWFALMPAWGSFHFYWVHRLLHWPPLYKRAHALHHRNVNVGPWSGISMHPIEHAIYFSSLLIHFIVPSSPMHVLFHVYTFTLHPICSHSGFDGLLAKGQKRAQLGDFFINCTIGTLNVIMGRLRCLGTDGLGPFMTAVPKRPPEHGHSRNRCIQNE